MSRIRTEAAAGIECSRMFAVTTTFGGVEIRRPSDSAMNLGEVSDVSESNKLSDELRQSRTWMGAFGVIGESRPHEGGCRKAFLSVLSARPTMTRLIVLRPEPGASETLERARRRGLEALSVPLFEVEPVPWKAPDPGRLDALLLTSANAVRHGGKQLEELRGLPIHAVGDATASCARDAGFEIRTIGGGGVDALLASLPADLTLLHLCGEHRREPADPRQAITSLVVYRAKEVVAPDVRAVEHGIVLIHSPRAGRRFAELVDRAALDRTTITIAAISRAAADAVGGCWRAIAAVDRPDDEALLTLAERLGNKFREG
jgi:uroporphyrinogen-III synthase